MFASINWRPTSRQLLQFGLTCLVVLPAIGWWWGASWLVLAALIAVGAGLVIAAAFCPAVVRPVFVALSLLAFPLGIVIGEAILLLIYYGVFFPFAVVFRLLGRDALERRIDREAKTYWRTKKQPRDVASYYRQS